MKGVVFTEFLAFVDETYGPETTEQVIAEAELPNGGGYTGVGNYDAAEMQALVAGLSARTGATPRDLLLALGRRLLGTFRSNHSQHFQSCTDVFQFAESIEQQIHVDVLKLYPDAELPRLRATRVSDGRLSLDYSSGRHMADLAEGLLHGAIAHFGETVALERIDLREADGEQRTRFVLTRA